MSKSKKPSQQEVPPLLAIMSGATGGAGTGRGVTYQIDYAVSQALNLIRDALSSPLNTPSIIIEPRTISGVEITRWDIGLQPDNIHIEAKVNLTRDDVEDWLKNVAKGSVNSPKKSFQLVYGEGSNPLFKTVTKLLRIAKEKENEKEEFKILVEREQVSDSKSALSILGINAHQVLQKMSVRLVPQNVLEEHIKTSAETLCGANGGSRLVEMLFDRFSHGMEKRKEFFVKDIIAEAQSRGIKFNWQPEITSSNYPVPVQAAIFLLQRCSSGLPVEVIAKTVGSSREQLDETAKSFIEEGKIIEENDTWQIDELSNEVTHEYADDLISRALDSVLEFIKVNQTNDKAFQQVDNAIMLAEVCTKRPRSVVHVFPILDKLLKRIGNLETVLYVANLSIEAGKHILQRTDEEVDSIARCYICGISWAYQRMPGHLDKARTAYNDSRKIAEGIDSRRSLAFIDKCLGRLCRKEAEEGDLSVEERKSKLRESVQLLEDGIEGFKNLEHYSSKDSDIGDCFSLLGRTYLVIGDLQKVAWAMAQSYPLMNTNSKEYADLLILQGDYESKQKNYPEAEARYTEALNIVSKANNSWSEIRARALFRRGLSFKNNSKASIAKIDFQAALEVWTELKRPHHIAEMQWEIILIDENLPSSAVSKFEKEPATIKVAMAQMHIESMDQRRKNKAYLSSREQPGDFYWEDLKKKARRQETIKNLND